MIKKAARKSITKLRAETDKLAREATRTKKQLDKVQHAADSFADKADGHKPIKTG